MNPEVELRVLGELDYGTALELQHELRRQLIEGHPGAGFILCLEHPPVVTLGKRGKDTDLMSPELLEARGVQVHRVDRGGEATYHGPGQLVIYPIVRLEDLGMGVVDLIRALARSLARVAADLGVDLEYNTDHPGLWTRESVPRKYASVGMRVSRGVTTHGAAFNITNDLSPFDWIIPCGMPGTRFGRMVDDVPDISVESFRQRWLDYAQEDLRVRWAQG